MCTPLCVRSAITNIGINLYAMLFFCALGIVTFYGFGALKTVLRLGVTFWQAATKPKAD